ncbi:MAG TPA: hypothetical protein VGB17_18620 [Pyrinomonadaceae bacterium]
MAEQGEGQQPPVGGSSERDVKHGEHDEGVMAEQESAAAMDADVPHDVAEGDENNASQPSGANKTTEGQPS